MFCFSFYKESYGWIVTVLYVSPSSGEINPCRWRRAGVEGRRVEKQLFVTLLGSLSAAVVDRSDVYRDALLFGQAK